MTKAREPQTTPHDPFDDPFAAFDEWSLPEDEAAFVDLSSETDTKPAASKPRGESTILSALRRSPLVGADLDFTRCEDDGRTFGD